MAFFGLCGQLLFFGSRWPPSGVVRGLRACGGCVSIPAAATAPFYGVRYRRYRFGLATGRIGVSVGPSVPKGEEKSRRAGTLAWPLPGLVRRVSVLANKPIFAAVPTRLSGRTGRRPADDLSGRLKLNWLFGSTLSV